MPSGFSTPTDVDPTLFTNIKGSSTATEDLSSNLKTQDSRLATASQHTRNYSKNQSKHRNKSPLPAPFISRVARAATRTNTTHPYQVFQGRSQADKPCVLPRSCSPSQLSCKALQVLKLSSAVPPNSPSAKGLVTPSKTPRENHTTVMDTSVGREAFKPAITSLSVASMNAVTR